MRAELQDANGQIKELLGVQMETFAYPCGQKFVGRGVETRRYVPIVASDFLAGRGWMDEAANDPFYCDLAQLTGVEMDGKSYKDLRTLVEDARKSGGWLVLGGHEMGKGGRQTTRLSELKRLLEYVHKPENRIWVAPMGTVAKRVRDHRGAK
jgi:hypothetical protein